MSLSSLKHHAKAVARSLIPPHRRLVRTGESFLADGEREVRELSRLVAPGTVAVDVGAHIGDYTYALSKHVGPGGSILAVEPIPALADTLARAVRGLGLPVTVVNCALSTAPGEATLTIPVAGGRRKTGFATLERREGAGTTIRVPVRTLDELCAGVAGRISFVKVDVEGHELDVFRGGVATLARHRPNLLVEIEQRHSSHPIAETFDFLIAQNYRIEFLDVAGHRRPFAAFDPALNRLLIDADGEPMAGYVSNFIFTPIEAPVLPA